MERICLYEMHFDSANISIEFVDLSQFFTHSLILDYRQNFKHVRLPCP